MEASSHTRQVCVFCDGTGALLGAGAQTNVVKLMAACGPSPDQLIFYDPGVGTNSTLPTTTYWQSVQRLGRQISGLAFGDGVYENIAEAYLFLVDNYQGVSDQLFFFGFSRGAFTARAVAGMVAMFGVVRPQASNLVDYMIQFYFSRDSAARQQLIADIRDNSQKFSARQLPVMHFVGVWDTVASVGIPPRRREFSQRPTIAGKRFTHVRHAVSADEYRGQFELRRYELGCDFHQTLKQVLFSGVHSDVGGQYVEAGLSNLTLDWMATEAEACGLRINHATLATQKARCPATALGHDQVYKTPLWALTGLRERPVHDPTQTEFTERRLTAGTAPGEPHSIWQPLWKRRGAFWLPLVLTLAFYALCYFMLLFGVDWGREHQSQAVRQLLAMGAWLSTPEIRQLAAEQLSLTHGLRLVLVGELLLIGALTALSCTLIVHGRMALLRSSVGALRRRVAQFSRWSVAALWLWISCDLLENMCLLMGTRDWWWSPTAADRADWLWLAACLGYPKFFGLAALAAMLMFALIARLTPRVSASGA